MHVTFRRSTLAVFAALSAYSASAAADDARSCIAIADEGQTTRDDGHLLDARADFESCARPSCPAPVRKQCAFWSAEVLARIPTVVFHLTRGGSDAVDARILVDGKAVAPPAAGAGLELDPGKHSLRFELAGALPVEEAVVLREGEKLHRIAASFATATEAPPPIAAAPPPSQPAPSVGPESAPREPAGVVELSALAGGGVPFPILEKGSLGPLLLAASIEAALRPVAALEAGLAIGVAGTGLSLEDAEATAAKLKPSGGYGRIEVALRGRWHFVRTSVGDVWAGPELDVFGDSLQLAGLTPTASFNHDTLLLGGGLIAGADFPVSKAFSLGVAVRGFGGFGVADWTGSCSGAACGSAVPGGTHDLHAFFDFGVRVLWSLPYGGKR
jgi:hypothetical protein